MLFVFALLHELGHVIAGTILDFKIISFIVQFYPFNWNNSYVQFLFPATVTKDELVFVYAGGSLFTLILGLIAFAAFYKKVMHPFLELFCFVYFLLLTLDFFIYNFVDIFFIHSGDWWNIYTLAPEINGIFLGLAIIFIALFLRYAEKIFSRVDIEILIKD